MTTLEVHVDGEPLLIVGPFTAVVSDAAKTLPPEMVEALFRLRDATGAWQEALANNPRSEVE